jgi:hypothetical protein
LPCNNQAKNLPQHIEEAEHARIKAMDSPNGAAAAVSAVTAKAKLAGLWREKIDQHSTGTVSTVWLAGKVKRTRVTPMSERKIIQIGYRSRNQIGRQSRRANRGHDRTVPEIGLDGASVVAVVGELEPAGVPQPCGNERGR